MSSEIPYSHFMYVVFNTVLKKFSYMDLKCENPNSAYRFGCVLTFQFCILQ